VVTLESRLTPAVTVTAGLNGLNNSGWYPPDTNLAVGPSHVMEIVNEEFGIYNKATGGLVASQSLSSLFSGFDTGGGYGTFDPTVLYDEMAGRFVIEAAVDDSSNLKAYVDFAVSNSSDPTQGFTEKQQIEVDEGGNCWVDNGKLGWNADAYIFTGNSYTFSTGPYAHELVLTIQKNSVLDQNAATLTDSVVDRSGNFSMIPTRMHGSASGGPMWFVETAWNGGSSIDVVSMTNVLSNSPSFGDHTVAVNSYSQPSSAPQPGGSVEIIDARTLNVEWNNNNLVAGFDSMSGSDAAAAWVEFQTGGASPSVVQQGVIHPATGVSTYFPGVGVDASGDLGMTYMESSASADVSMYVTGRLASDPVNTLQPATDVAAGNAAVNPGRGGDYAGIALDPSAANTFWAANEYGLSGTDWGTWLSQFTITSGSNEPPPTVVTPASASPNVVIGTSTSFSVLGADDDGESSLTYTWAVTSQPAGAASPSFSVNGTNDATIALATLYQAGAYTFQVTIVDPSSLSVTSSVTVTVNQTATSIGVFPANVTLPNGSTEQFSAVQLDQFGQAMASQPSFSWSLSAGGVGSVSSNGLYTAPSSETGTAVVTATAGAMTGDASVTVSSIPPAPTNLTVTVGGPRQVSLAWTENYTNVDAFVIDRSSDGGASWTVIATVGGNLTTFLDTTVNRNTTYEYRIAAQNASGTSPWSNVATVKTPHRAPGRTHSPYPEPDFPTRVHVRAAKHHHDHHAPRHADTSRPHDRPRNS
jgi:hypothetical protein